MNVSTDKFDYNRVRYEEVSCNFCGRDQKHLLSKRDRYNLAVNTVICKKCGLIFISPRMLKEDYKKFYEIEYRNLCQRYKNKKLNLPATDKIFELSRRWGLELANIVAPYIKPGLTIEVGSGSGGVLKGFQDRYKDLEVIGIEPSPTEADYAVKKGIKTHVSLFENFQNKLPLAQNIIIARSLNHLLSPKDFFIWSHNQLAKDGHLIIVVLNFRTVCERKGRIYSQIDHPYMFTSKVLKNFVESAGFDIDFFTNIKKQYILLIAKKLERKPFVDIKVDSKTYKKNLLALSPSVLKISYYLKNLAGALRRL